MEPVIAPSRLVIYDHFLAEYAAAGLFLLIAFGISFLLIAIAFLRGSRAPTPRKRSAYECGFEALTPGHIRFEVRYYLIAILFIILDIETIFLFPWAVALKEIGWFGFLSMFIFLMVLAIGFVYEWRKGALEGE